MSPLADLVGDVDHFGDHLWGRAPLHRVGAAGTSPVPFGVDDVDRIVTSAVRVPAIRLVRQGTRVEPSRFCAPTRIGNQTLDDVADPRKVLDEYRRGATVVLQTLHRTWGPLSAWCADLEAELGWPVQCNAYLSPPSSAGLAKHRDGHDVFAVQLHGAKRWFVDGLGELTMDAGDVLYVPAGVDHVAGTEDLPSLHLTIGVHRPSPDRLARAALAAVAPVPTAPPVPIGRSASLAGVFAATVDDMVTALQDEPRDSQVGSTHSTHAPVDRRGAFESRLRRPPRRHPGGIVDAAIRHSALDDATLVTAVAGFEVRVDATDGRVRCAWDGGALRLPPIVAGAMAHLAAHPGPVAVGDLPGLDAEDRRTLVRRLADEGAVVAVVAVAD
jgi:lysine-specific demethylase/histidyl-hydroxylase NO66